MKGNSTVIAELNSRLSEECTAVVQYITHSQMCENWGYSDLASYIKRRAIEEMKHSEMLIERILFLEGTPSITLGEVFIGEDVAEMHDNDRDAEADAIAAYNNSIKVCIENNDFGTRKLLENILSDEEAHISKIEEQIVQIDQMTLQNYLVEQI